EHYPGYAGCASVRPPGTDTRRPPPPPPLAGVVSFSALPVSSKSAKLLVVAECRSHCVRVAASGGGRLVHNPDSIPNLGGDPGAASRAATGWIRDHNPRGAGRGRRA